MKKLTYKLYSEDNLLETSDCKQDLFDLADIKYSLPEYIIDTVLNDKEIIKHEIFKNKD